MSYNALLFGGIAGILTFIFKGDLDPLIITNFLLGLIAGSLFDKRKP